MSFAFLPAQPFFGTAFLSRTKYAQAVHKIRRQYHVQASLSARERRRAVELARTATHKNIKDELEKRTGDRLNAIVSVPSFVRERCSLTRRLSRVKVFLEQSDAVDFCIFRRRVRSGLVRLFPELVDRGLLRDSDGFDVKVAGGAIVSDNVGLRRGVEKCEKVGTTLFVEVIPHNTPPPKPPLSRRIQEVADRATAAANDPELRLRMLSFYKFVQLQNPALLSELLQKTWAKMGVKGRVYVASEGINAQLAVPEPILQDFYDAMEGSWIERNEPLMPTEIVGVFLNTDGVVHHSEQPFEKLTVRPRDKVLADGFKEALDWNRSGREVSPAEWHKVLTEKSSNAVVLDCRNVYESDVGRFEGAESLKTSSFRESWDYLEKRLRNEDRSTEILTYCTGGIRCVKVNAYLEQKMGFTNTGRLEGGIVSYARMMREDGRLDESVFKGVNHVFDGRMGEVITADLLHSCITCGQPCNLQTDCANVSCPRSFSERMFVQCEDCAVLMKGACGESCRQILTSEQSSLSHAQVNRRKAASFSRDCSANDMYADEFSIRESPLLKELRKRTETQFPGRAHMLSGHTQASLLRLLIQIADGCNVLELGTFTGYAALAMAAALPQHGKVVTCELDEIAANVAEEFFKRDTLHGRKISLLRGDALDILTAMVTERTPAFDVAFIDANKGGYREYKDLLLANNLVRIGGLVIFDNVLFRGEVAEEWIQNEGAGKEGVTSFDTDDYEQDNMIRKGVKNLRNARKTAKKLHSFNEDVKRDCRIEQVLLPLRDGLTVARRVR